MAARTSTGTWTATSNSFNPAVTGTTITAADWNAILDELEVEITDALSRSGKGGMLADLDMSNNNVKNLASASADHHAVRFDQVYAYTGNGPGTKGLVPASSAGDATANKFLKADGSWAVPAGAAGAPDTADYLVLSANSTLGSERVFAITAPLTATDAGVGNAYTVGVHLATAGDYWRASAGAVLESSATWEAAKPVALVDAATVTANFAAGINFTLTLGGNRTLKIENAKEGQNGAIYITQSGGARTLAYSSMLRFAGGTAPALSTSLSTASGAWDILSYNVLSANFIAASLAKNVK